MSRSMSSMYASRGILARARCSALADWIEQAGTEKPALVVCLANLQMTGAELERLLKMRDRFLERIDAGERPIQFYAFGAWLPGHVDAGKFLVRGHHQVGVGLVVEQPGVVFRLNVLDEPVLGQKRLDLTVGLNDLKVDDQFPQRSLLEIELGGRLKIAGDPVAQAGGFADINHAALVILHQVDAGRFREGFGLFGKPRETIVHECAQST